LKVSNFIPSGKEKILIIVPLHEHVASLSPSLLMQSFKMGLLCALIVVFMVKDKVSKILIRPWSFEFEKQSQLFFFRFGDRANLPKDKKPVSNEYKISIFSVE
jgi:hypothetical protein